MADYTVVSFFLINISQETYFDQFLMLGGTFIGDTVYIQSLLWNGGSIQVGSLTVNQLQVCQQL